jgi:hypothetical protein
MSQSSPISEGFPNTANLGDVRDFADRHSLRNALEKHADPSNSFHIDLSSMFVSWQGFSASSLDFSLFFTNVWFMLTIFRVMISGWKMCIFCNLFHRFCTAKVKMICYGCCTLGYRLNPIMFGVVPDHCWESEDMYVRSWMCVPQAIALFVNLWKHCGKDGCTTCDAIRSFLTILAS